MAIATERHLIMKNPDSRRGRKDRRKEPRYQVKRRGRVRSSAKTLRGASSAGLRVNADMAEASKGGLDEQN
ncbi:MULTISPECIES: hypothetical protein [unclassified Caulobacter]|uniref:hypothetical protein n=1 Tax=unclassified Caulobacter TaxID=2648921 RepID=UPI00143D47D5|nr:MULTISPECIES: hypothetical protein [unclassified Caulobacter]